MNWFDDETKVMVVFLGFFCAATASGFKCAEYNKAADVQKHLSEGQKRAVQIECLKNHPPIECKEMP